MIGAALPSPPLATPSGIFASLFLLNRRFVCRVEEVWYLASIHEDFSRSKGRMEGLSALN